MNVIVINDFAYVNGGAASVAIASAKGLARRGHRVMFVSAVGPVDCRLTEAGIQVVCTRQHEILADPNRLRAAWQGIWNPVAARAVAVFLAEVKPQDTVVHLHGWTKALSTSVLRIALQRGFRVVCTLHDYFSVCPNGGFFNHRGMKHCHLKPLSLACIACNCDPRSYAHKLWRVARQLAQRTLGGMPSGIDGFIVLSRLSRSVLAPYLPSKTPVFEIPNPIDVEREDAVEVAGNRSFVMIGRLTAEKGCLLLARAAGECGAPVVFVGDGPSRADIASTNPSAAVTGWLSRVDVDKYLSHSRALVFPSQWYEAQPLVVLEALARGVPAVVSDDCAAAESIQHGVTGLLFKGGNFLALAQCLRELSDDSVVKRLGRSAYEGYWASPLTLQNHVSLLESAYDAVLRGRGDKAA